MLLWQRLVRDLQPAGFASAGVFWGPPNPHLEFTIDEAAAYVEQFEWPSTVVNEFMEVVAANRIAQRLWRIDLRDRKDPAERNLLGVVSRPPFCDLVVNWDEAVGVAIAVMKGHYRGPETQPQGSSAYFAHVMRRHLFLRHLKMSADEGGVGKQVRVVLELDACHLSIPLRVQLFALLDQEDAVRGQGGIGL